MGVAVALEGVGPMTLAAGRVVIGGIALLLLALALGLPMPRPGSPEGRRLLLFGIAMGALSNALPFVLISWGQQYVTSAFAGVSMAAVPLFVLALAHFLVPGEGLTPARIVGFLLGVAGVGLLVGGDALARGGGPLEDLGRAACILAAASYAVGAIITRRCPPVNPIAIGAVALLAASGMLAPLALALEGVPVPGDIAPLAQLSLLYLGLAPTALGTLILVRVIRSAGPGFLTQVNYHVPLWAVVFGALLLGEAVTGTFAMALVLILSGLAVGQGLYRHLRPRRADT